MFTDKGKYFQIDDFEKYGITAVYTTKEIGDIDILFKDKEKSSEDIEKCFGKKNAVVVYAKQSHTDNIVFIEKDTEKYFYEDVDGFITKRKDIVLMTQYADCLPIFLYDKENDVISVCHSGWKGSFKGIGLKAIDLMNEKYGSKPENIIVALGIGVQCKNYEVGEEFYNEFKEKFDNELIEKSFKFTAGKWHFGNIEFNKIRFLRKGILSKNLIVSHECTYGNTRFNSFRREKNKNRNGGLIFYK